MWNTVLIVLLGAACVLLYVRNRRLKSENRQQKEKRGSGGTPDVELLLKNIHAYLLLITSDFSVLKTNYYVETGAEATENPKRVGDLLGCINAVDSSGCGSHEYCTRCPVRRAIAEAFRTRSDFKDVEAPMRIRLSEHETIDCELSVSGSFLQMDGQDRMWLTIYDITRQKQIQKELLRAKEQAESSDRLKTAFLANMSHEIRTPLNAIVGFSALLDTENKEERELYLDIINRNNELLLQLINDILDLSKIEAGTLEFTHYKTDVFTLVNNLTEMFRKRLADAGSSVQIIFESSPEGVVLVTDDKRVTQVLSNLIGNAMKFTERGFIRIGYRYQGADLRFYVSDTGPGIAPEQQAQVFGRFVKLDTGKPGTGLGLAISRMIVEKLRGTIGVESQPGEGATFWFTLPLTEADR